MKRSEIYILALCIMGCAHFADGAGPLTPNAQKALKIAQSQLYKSWMQCDDILVTEVLRDGGGERFGFHAVRPLSWKVEKLLFISPDGKNSGEEIYKVSAYTPRYRSWIGGQWMPWHTGMPWEEGNIEIFNTRVTIPTQGSPTHASQYFIFTDGIFRKPLCSNVPSG
jgi:hypothetical protein